MPRDASGNYTLPLADVVTGTTITATWANTTLADIKAALTDSLSRSGDGTLTAPIGLVDGSAVLPALAFLNAPNTGLYRAGTNDIRLSLNGTDIVRWYDTGTPRVAISADFEVAGATRSQTLIAQSAYPEVTSKHATVLAADLDNAGGRFRLTTQDDALVGASGFLGNTHLYWTFKNCKSVPEWRWVDGSDVIHARLIDGNLSLPLSAPASDDHAMTRGAADARYAKIFAEAVFNVDTNDAITSVYERGFGALATAGSPTSPYYTAQLDTPVTTENLIVQATVDYIAFGPSSPFAIPYIIQARVTGSELQFKVFDGFAPGDVVTGSAYRVHVMLTESVAV